MHLRNVFLALLSASMFAATAPAYAVIITGSFAGTAENSSWRDIVNGAPILGGFSLDTSGFQPSGGSQGRPGRYGGDEGAFRFRFQAPWTGLDYTMGSAYVNIDLYDDGIHQTVDILSQYVHGQSGFFHLVAPSGTLFSDIDDLSSLRAGPLDLSRSRIHFDDHAWIGFDLDASRLSIADATQVPEPASGALLLSALTVAWTARRAHNCGNQTA